MNELGFSALEVFEIMAIKLDAIPCKYPETFKTISNVDKSNFGLQNKIQPKLPGIRIALIVDVRAIPIIQRYPDECRIKTRLSGRAFVTFQSIIRETAMNFENKTKRLPETVFFLREGKFLDF